MIYFRQTNKLTTKAVAKKLGIKEKMYSDIEKGDQFLSEETARHLGELYNVDGQYFHIASHQDMEYLQLGRLLLDIQLTENDMLKLEGRRLGLQAQVVTLDATVREVNLKKFNNIKSAINKLSVIRQKIKVLLKNMEA